MGWRRESAEEWPAGLAGMKLCHFIMIEAKTNEQFRRGTEEGVNVNIWYFVLEGDMSVLLVIKIVFLHLVRPFSTHGEFAIIKNKRGIIYVSSSSSKRTLKPYCDKGKACAVT
jgi:hypothetical protein